MQILGLFGMHFDDVVVEVKTFLLLFRLALAKLWDERNRIKSKSIGTQIEGKQPDRQVGRVGTNIALVYHSIIIWESKGHYVLADAKKASMRQNVTEIKTLNV